MMDLHNTSPVYLKCGDALVRNADKLWEEEDARSAVGARVAYGAICCDKLAFGQQVYSAAENQRR
jgi:hypothetical protein